MSFKDEAKVKVRFDLEMAEKCQLEEYSSQTHISPGLVCFFFFSNVTKSPERRSLNIIINACLSHNSSPTIKHETKHNLVTSDGETKTIANQKPAINAGNELNLSLHTTC